MDNNYQRIRAKKRKSRKLMSWTSDMYSSYVVFGPFTPISSIYGAAILTSDSTSLKFSLFSSFQIIGFPPSPDNNISSFPLLNIAVIILQKTGTAPVHPCTKVLCLTSPKGDWLVGCHISWGGVQGYWCSLPCCSVPWFPDPAPSISDKWSGCCCAKFGSLSWWKPSLGVNLAPSCFLAASATTKCRGRKELFSTLLTTPRTIATSGRSIEKRLISAFLLNPPLSHIRSNVYSSNVAVQPNQGFLPRACRRVSSFAGMRQRRARWAQYHLGQRCRW